MIEVATVGRPLPDPQDNPGQRDQGAHQAQKSPSVGNGAQTNSLHTRILRGKAAIERKMDFNTKHAKSTKEESIFYKTQYPLLRIFASFVIFAVLKSFVDWRFPVTSVSGEARAETL